MSDASIITIIIAVVAGIVWAVRIEGKVIAHDREISQLRADTKHHIAEMRTDLQYIRQRLDEVIEHRRQR